MNYESKVNADLKNLESLTGLNEKFVMVRLLVYAILDVAAAIRENTRLRR